MNNKSEKIKASKTNPESWRQVKEIFLEVLEQPEEMRSEFLEEACSGDLILKREVEDLLAAHFESESFIETPAFELASIFKSNGGAAHEGKRFGNYKIIREIGVGGMGAVFLAERDDGEFRQQVAVKIVRFTLADSEIISRFKRERQILASLNHPNIAKLLDGGVTPDGLPFLAMEYIEGEPITHYIEQENLTESERLRIFLKICSAVAYAHRNLIVHRDIKPSNILVTKDGEPKLLDFGLAKILDEGLADDNKTQTAFRAMTPAYASPEQISGAPVTTLSDIYSLGKVLLEILRIPQKKDVRETIDKSQALPADLQNIVAVALSEEPERRYNSAEAFAEDISRYLKKLPVAARRNSFSYRAEKFIRRNKIAAVAGLLIILTLFASAAATVWQAQKAARERDKALAAQVRAERINSFLQDMLKSASPEESGKDAKVIDVLNDAASRIDAEFNDEPEQKIEILLTLAQTYQNLNILDAAEQKARDALALSIQNFGENSKLAAYSQINLGKTLVVVSRHLEAENLLRKAMQTQQNLALTETKEYAQTEYVLGELLLRENNFKEAEPLLNNALKLQTEFFGENSSEVITVELSIGRMHEFSGDLNAAENSYRKTAEFFRQSPRYRTGLILSLVNLGRVLIARGKYEEAEAALLEGLDISQSILGNASYVRGMIQNYRSSIQFYKGDFASAEKTSKEALNSLETVVSKDDAEILNLKTRLGASLTKQGKFKEAEETLRPLSEIVKIRQNNELWRVPLIQLRLGQAILGDNRLREAEPLILAAYDGFHSSFGDKNLYTQEAVKTVATLYEKLNNHELSAKYRALETTAAP